MIRTPYQLRKAINKLNNNVEFTTLRRDIHNAENDLLRFKALHEPKLLELLLSTNPSPRRGENVEITLKNSWLLDEVSLEKYYRLVDEYWKNLGYELEKGVCPILIKENEILEMKLKYYPIGASALGLDYEEIKLKYTLCKELEKLIDDIIKLRN